MINSNFNKYKTIIKIKPNRIVKKKQTNILNNLKNSFFQYIKIKITNFEIFFNLIFYNIYLKILKI